MSIIGSNTLAGASGGAGSASGYTIERSLRFNDADTAYLDRTFSEGSRTTWTWSGWIKLGEQGSQYLFTTTTASINAAAYIYISVNQFHYWDASQANHRVVLRTNGLFKDTSAWYHIVLTADRTNATSTDRARLYVNGVRWTSFETTNYPNANEDSYVNAATAHYIGGGTVYFNGYLAENHFIDGQALEATDFGEFDEDTGAWNPIEYTGTYGTNGYYLDFNDNTSTTTLGEDASGNSNDWTLNNFSVASGADNDSMVDSPTNYEASSGNNGGNYATLNPVDAENATLTNGSLDVTLAPGDIDNQAVSTIGVTSGKYYWETQVKGSGGTAMIGVADLSEGKDTRGWYNRGGAWAIYQGTGSVWSGGTSATAYGSTYSYDDIIGIALNMDSNTITWYINGVSQGAYTPTGMNGPIGAYLGCGSATYGSAYNINFGQRPFAYTPPADHLSLCTANLPDPVVAKPSTGMDATIYSGNGTSQDVDGFEFSPDFVWMKQRGGTSTRYHYMQDTVRGENLIFDQTTQTEVTITTAITSFNSDGFSLGNNLAVNENLNEHIAYAWDAGANSDKTYMVKVVSDSGNKYRFDDFGTSAVTLELAEGSTYVFDQSDASNATHPLRFATAADAAGGTEYTTGVTAVGTPGSAGAKTTITVASGAPTLYYYCSSHTGMGGQANTNDTAGASNFDGTVQATVQANPTYGFSIIHVNHTSGGDGTVGHGLNAVPDLIIEKERTGNGSAWVVRSSVLPSWTSQFYLNYTNNSQELSGNWNVTNPTSETISFDWDYMVGNATDVMYYVWSEVEGFSKFGTYEGHGASGQPFIYTGFRPKLIWIKAYSGGASSNGHWLVIDSERGAYNDVDKLFLTSHTTQTSNALEYTVANMAAFYSNGFQILDTNSARNGDGNMYAYFAFAESPFKTARAR